MFGVNSFSGRYFSDMVVSLHCRLYYTINIKTYQGWSIQVNCFAPLILFPCSEKNSNFMNFKYKSNFRSMIFISCPAISGVFYIGWIDTSPSDLWTCQLHLKLWFEV